MNETIWAPEYRQDSYMVMLSGSFCAEIPMTVTPIFFASAGNAASVLDHES